MVDAPDVTEKMRTHFSQRVLPEQPRLDIHARETEAVGREFGHLLVCQARADGQAVGALGLDHQALEAYAVALPDLDDAREVIDYGLDVSHLVRGDLQRVRGVVARQHHAVAVGDEAAVGYDGHDGNAVVLRFGLVVVMLHHLQINEARQENAEQRQYHGAGNADAQLEEIKLAFVVAELSGHGVSSRRRPDQWWRLVCSSPWRSHC